MNKDEVSQLLLDMWNAQGAEWHADLLADTERLDEYRKYSWFTEEFEPLEELEWDEIIYEIKDQKLNGYELKSIEHVGGEGEGDNVHWVFTITDPEGNLQYWKLSGYYASYTGSDWSSSEPYKVTPKIKQVTFYE